MLVVDDDGDTRRKKEWDWFQELVLGVEASVCGDQGKTPLAAGRARYCETIQRLGRRDQRPGRQGEPKVQRKAQYSSCIPKERLRERRQHQQLSLTPATSALRSICDKLVAKQLGVVAIAFDGVCDEGGKNITPEEAFARQMAKCVKDGVTAIVVAQPTCHRYVYVVSRARYAGYALGLSKAVRRELETAGPCESERKTALSLRLTPSDVLLEGKRRLRRELFAPAIVGPEKAPTASAAYRARTCAPQAPPAAAKSAEPGEVRDRAVIAVDLWRYFGSNPGSVQGLKWSLRWRQRVEINKRPSEPKKNARVTDGSIAGLTMPRPRLVSAWKLDRRPPPSGPRSGSGSASSDGGAKRARADVGVESAKRARSWRRVFTRPRWLRHEARAAGCGRWNPAEVRRWRRRARGARLDRTLAALSLIKTFKVGDDGRRGGAAGQEVAFEIQVLRGKSRDAIRSAIKRRFRLRGAQLSRLSQVLSRGRLAIERGSRPYIRLLAPTLRRDQCARDLYRALRLSYRWGKDDDAHGKMKQMVGEIEKTCQRSPTLAPLYELFKVTAYAPFSRRVKWRPAGNDRRVGMASLAGAISKVSAMLTRQDDHPWAAYTRECVLAELSFGYHGQKSKRPRRKTRRENRTPKGAREARRRPPRSEPLRPSRRRETRAK